MENFSRSRAVNKDGKLSYDDSVSPRLGPQIIGAFTSALDAIEVEDNIFHPHAEHRVL